jgi:tetratricopeptide (TPR) repeat protein
MQEKHAGLLRLSGDLFFKEGQLEKASDYYKKAIALDSHLLEALKGLGQTARARGDLQEARVSFQRLYQLDNSYLPLLEELADEYIHKGQLDRAYELVQPLADDLAKTPDPQDAVRLLRKILTKDEYYPEANHQLIDIYLQHDRTNNALIALEKIATFLLSQNRRQEAVPYLKQMVEIDPDNLNWRSQLDQIEEQVQSFPGFGAAEEQPEPPLEAVSHDFSLLEAEPQAQEHDLEHFEFEEESSFVEDTQMSIGNLLTEIDVYIRYQQLDKAEKFIDEILAKDPLHFEANQKRKQVFLEKNDFKGVAKTNLILAKHFVDKGQLDIAIDLIDEAGEHFPAEARKLQGEIEHLQNLENSRQNESVQAQAYDPDFTDSSQNVIDLHQDQLVFDQGEQEVVEFKKKTTLFDDFSGDGGDEEWGLDLPVTEEEPVEDPVAFKETEEDELSDDLFLDPELLAEVGRDADDSEEAQQTIEEGVISGLGDTEAEEIPKMEDPPLKHEGLEAAMEEIQFFLSMDAHEEALNLIHTALQNFGPHSELLTKQEELKSALSSTSAGNSDDSNPHDVGIFDLGADVDLAFDMVRDVTDNSVPEEFKNVDELFEQFKKGVAEQVADNDYQTHYDLGIGYKEMGLLDEAINEFRIVLQDPDRFLDANAMIAVCQKELGQSDQAVDTLKTALERNTLKAEERSELLYDLALTQESLGELEDAILTFQELNQHHPGFRDVEERLQDLM